MKCQYCQDGKLILKDEVTYVYSYYIGNDGSVKWHDEEGYTPYLFFNRDQKDFKQVVECDQCHKSYDFKISKDYDREMVILKKAIHSIGDMNLKPFV